MNLKHSLVVLGCAALCGIAFAQTQKPPTATERLDALELEVKTLRQELSSLKLASAEEVAAARKETAETRALANHLAAWAAGQADGAAALALVLDDSEKKGFTFGINPESRVALLAGWRSFAAGLQKDVPKALAVEEPKPAAAAKAPPAKNP
jgi:hypothetical protein